MRTAAARVHRRLPVSLGLLGALMLASALASAQPTLTVQRVVNNWPTIETYLRVECGGLPLRMSDVDALHVRERGIPQSITLKYPPVGPRCAMSAALVLDGSASMSGATRQSALAGASAWIRRMDDAEDRAAVLFFNDSVTVAQVVSRDTAQLQAVLLNLPAGGGTALWDAMADGILELAGADITECRVLICLADGDDTRSTRTPADVIALALRHRVRVFTIGLGSAVSGPALQAVSDATAGQSYLLTSFTPTLLARVYEDIADLTLDAFGETLITYDAACEDGAFRPVHVEVRNICSGSDTVATSILAPRDTTTFDTLRIALSSAITAPASDIALALSTPDTLGGAVFTPVTAHVIFDTARMDFLGAVTTGMLLDGMNLTTTIDSTGVHLRTTGAHPVSGTGLLAELRFRVRDAVGRDTLPSPVSILSWSFAEGCLIPETSDGLVRIIERPSVLDGLLALPPRLHWVDTLSRYVPDTLIVTAVLANPGARPTRSAGALLRFDTSLVTLDSTVSALQFTAAPVLPGGSANVTWRLVLGARLPNDSLTLCATLVEDAEEWTDRCAALGPLAVPPVRVIGPSAFCDGGATVLVAHPILDSIRWSTGDTSRIIVVRSSGTYSYTAMLPDSSFIRSQERTIVVHPLPTPVLTALGPTALCSGDSVTIEAPAGFTRYRWSSGDTTRRVTTHTAGSWSVTVTDGNGCEGTSPALAVTVSPRPAPVVQGADTVCARSSVAYTTDAAADHRYVWEVFGGTLLTGQGSNAILVRWHEDAAGLIRVHETDTLTGCAASTERIIRITAIPVPHIAPAGPITACEGDTIVLDAGAGYAEYAWSNGADTRLLRVTRSGAFIVRGTVAGGCAAISDTVFVTFLPRPRPAVSGPAKVCIDAVTLYATPERMGHSYQWTVTGGSIATGQGTATVAVRWTSATAGQVRVSQSNGVCAVSDTLDVDITTFVKPVVTADGPTRFCQGGDVTLDAGPGYVSYEWSTGARTRTITVSGSGIFSVFVVLDGGCSGASDPVDVVEFPPAVPPTISRNGNVLLSSPAARYQWSVDGSPLAGETNQFLVLTRPGLYSVAIVDTNGCGAESQQFLVETIVSIERPPSASSGLLLYPEPNDGLVTVRLRLAAPVSVALLRVHDLLGRERYVERVSVPGNVLDHHLDLRALPPGTYVVTVDAGTVRYTRSILKRR